MSDQALTGMPLFVDGQGGAWATGNGQFNIITSLAALKILDRDLTAPPGSESDGDAYIVAASATGDWAGHDGDIAVYYNGYYFLTPWGGMQVFVHDEKMWYGYSSQESAWHPMQIPHSTSEIWTGRYDRNGSKIYSRVIDLGALPNNTSKTVAHSITNLDLAKRVLFEGWADDGGTTIYPLPYANAGGTARMALKIDSSNVTITTNFDASAYGGEVRLEYCRT